MSRRSVARSQILKFLNSQILKLSFLFLFSIFNFQFSIAQEREIERQNAVKQRAQERLAEIERQNKALSGDITKSERSLRQARSTIQAKRKIADELDAESRRVSAEMSEGVNATRRLDNSLARLRKDYGGLVRASWKNHLTHNATLLVLSASDFNDASRRIAFIRRYNRARERKAGELDSLNRQVKAQVERLSAKKQELTGLRSESNKLLAGLRKEEAQYEKSIKTLGSNRQKLQAEAKRERKKIEAAQSEINKIMARQAAAAKSTPLSEADLALSGKFEENRGRLPWPTGAPGLILHHFGKQRSTDGIESDFKGLIIAARPGSDVRAVFEGTVTLITNLGQYDKCVMVRSGEFVVGYGNIASATVKSGDKVSVNQAIGRVTTAADEDRHLVMLWMQQGSTVLDPEKWLRK